MSNRQKKPRQPLGRIVRNCFRMMVKIARIAPVYFVGVLLEGLLWGVMNSVSAVFTLRLFNALDAGSAFSELAAIIGIMAAFYTVAYSLNSWYWEYWWQLQRKKMDFRLHEELFAKARTMDIACYDDPEFYNDFVWSMNGSANQAADMMRDVSRIINRTVSGGTLFTLMFSIDGWVALVLLVTSALMIVVEQYINKISFEQEKEMQPLNRVRDYVNRIFHLPEYAKEMRLSSVADVLIDKLDQNTEQTVCTNVKYGKKYLLFSGLLDTVLRQIPYFGILFYMFYKLLNGEVLIGEFAATLGMIWSVRWALANLVEHLSKFSKTSLFLEKYYGFLSYEPRVKSGERAVPPFESLELRNVSFTYDFSDNPRYLFHEQSDEHKAGKSGEALRGVDLSLKRGEKIAIVGYNGAGKTTLIKLLMRLYDPTDGQVLLNGVDIREYKLEDYRDRIGTVFQDFRIFAAGIAENVMHGVYNEETDKETVLSALDAAGFTERLSRMEHGIDTVLTREFDDEGINLSGGEAQKVAIARVFAKPFELIIMDEPSSALDPVAEYELNQAILRYAADKTVIFISHRLSTTRMADRIYMFASGELKEVGTHDELMALGGQYAEMFELQAEKYKSE